MTDLKGRKIYNIVLMPALILGIVINIYTTGWVGLMTSVQGLILGLIFLILPFILGGLGAGDVKLLATIGAIKGTEFTLYTFIGMGLSGGILATVLLVFQGRLLKTIKGLFQGLWLLASTGGRVGSFTNSNDQNMIPYGVAIVTGAVYALMMVG